MIKLTVALDIEVLWFTSTRHLQNGHELDGSSENTYREWTSEMDGHYLEDNEDSVNNYTLPKAFSNFYNLAFREQKAISIRGDLVFKLQIATAII
jgi:hypothetical protein